MEKMTKVQLKEKLQDLGVEGFLKFLAEKYNLDVGYIITYTIAQHNPESRIISDHHMKMDDIAILSIFQYEDRYDFVIERLSSSYIKINKDDDTKTENLVDVRASHIEFAKTILNKLQIDSDSVIEAGYRSPINPALPVMGGQLVILK